MLKVFGIKWSVHSNKIYCGIGNEFVCISINKREGEASDHN